MTEDVGRKPIPAIAEYRSLRFMFVFLLYVAQGVPVGVFFLAIPAWLAANGASALEVGAVLSATSLPWTLKFVNGFIMDRYTFLPMGRRRAWLIGAQTAMVSGLILFAIVNPAARDIASLSAFAFAIQAFTTLQDVAVDGMAVDLIPDHERARANGLMFGGQSIGMAAGSAFTGFAIAAAGLPAAMLGNAAFVGFVLLLLIVFRERPGERLLPWTPGRISAASAAVQVDAWWPLIKSVWKAMFTRDSGYHIVAQIAVGALYGFNVGLMPLIAVNVTGWTAPEVSALTGSSTLLAGVLGVFLFGLIADRFGSRPTTIVGFCLMGGGVAVFLLSQTLWAQSATIRTAAFIYDPLYTMTQIAICASAMKICSLKVAATQFTLFMAIANLGITLASMALGPLEALGGYVAILGAMIVVAVIGAGAMFMFNESRMKALVAGDGALPAAA